MSGDGDAFIRRDVWGDWFDKVWWLGGTLFYGSPFVALLITGLVKGITGAVVVGGPLVVGVGVLNWVIRARSSGRLLVEITTEGIRVVDGASMLPWSAVSWVGYGWVGGGGAVAPSRALVLHLAEGGQVEHVFAGFRIEGIHDDVRDAIRRLAPQVPLSDDDRPPAGVE
ncbi:hypothetical protein [Plantactinospora sp. B5E13]|uniref:hypothetical protein n=1 Tax=unclassified Plantactinospora TaxID=2631981 RepID=UPI00325E8D1A